MRKADINIEFAHIDFSLPIDSSACEAQIRESGRLAREYLRAQSNAHYNCTTSILIDDKNCTNPPSMDQVSEFLGIVGDYGPQVDFVCFESTLPDYESELIKQVVPEERNTVRAAIERYKTNHGSLGCSHDIAIWHMLRLGLLGTVRSRSVIQVGIVAQRAKPFFAERVVSILSKEFRAYEEKARHDLLVRCIDKDLVRKIQIIWF